MEQNKLQKKVYLTLLSNVTIEFNSINECATVLGINYHDVKNWARKMKESKNNFVKISFYKPKGFIIKYKEKYDLLLNNVLVTDDFGCSTCYFDTDTWYNEDYYMNKGYN